MAITDSLCRSFLDLWWHFDPAAATWAGITAHDGRLGAFDPDSIRQHAAAFRSIAGAVEDLEVEDTADEIDRTALLDHLRVLLFRFEHEHPYQKNPALWIEHLDSAFEGLLARGAGDAELAAAALDRLREVPAFLRTARASLRKPPVLFVETALALLAETPALLDETARRFGADWSREGGDGAGVMTEAKTSLEQLSTALRGLAVDPDPHAAAIGEDEVDRRLHYEHASIHNAAEVWRGALRLAAEVESEVSALAAAIDPARTWRELYEQAREESPVWSQLEAELREALEQNTRLLESRGISAVAPPLELAELSPAARVLEPLACYQPAGLVPAALLVGDPDRAALPWLAARLGIPGLHLQRSRRDALPGLVRRHVTATSTSLGWCLYAQELLPELGFMSEPESRLIERVLFLRDVQLGLVDLGLHTKQLTPDEAVGQLTAQVPGDPAAALADVRRLACRPTSGCAAILGRQELRRLREDFLAARGDAGTLEDFQLEVFGYGGLPVPLIRWGMGLDA
ncbi:MAG TPA: DUF885 family protein [Gemmatimonadales bacterium]|nr:DUF885 family protein [Gemmatimonadales bacterium]